jgi:hypothetical protein
MRAPSWRKFRSIGYDKGFADVRYTSGLGVIICVCGIYHELTKGYEERRCNCGRTFRMRMVIEVKEPQK